MGDYRTFIDKLNALLYWIISHQPAEGGAVLLLTRHSSLKPACHLQGHRADVSQHLSFRQKTLSDLVDFTIMLLIQNNTVVLFHLLHTANEYLVNEPLMKTLSNT